MRSRGILRRGRRFGCCKFFLNGHLRVAGGVWRTRMGLWTSCGESGGSTGVPRPRRRLAVPHPVTVVALVLLGSCSSPTRLPSPPVRAVRVDPPPVAAPVRAWTPIGRSREGQPLEALTLGAGPRRAYLVGGIHGDERVGLGHVDDLVLRLGASAGSADWTLRILRDANPDGSALGRRTSVIAVDLNRNWPATNFTPARNRGPRPLSEPETAALARDLLAFEPELVIVFHAARGGPFVNYDVRRGGSPSASPQRPPSTTRAGTCARTWAIRRRAPSVPGWAWTVGSPPSPSSTNGGPRTRPRRR